MLKCSTQYVRKFGKLSSGQRTGKGQFSFQSPKKGNAKEFSHYCTIALISYASKVMLNILQPGLQQYINWDLSDVQARFQQSRGTRDQISNIRWIINKRLKKKKKLLLLRWLCLSFWLYGSQQTAENSQRVGNTRPPYPPPEKPVLRSRSKS